MRLSFVEYAFVLIASLLSILQAGAFYEPGINAIGIEQGLSNNPVRCILQDHKGFMWLGTFNGLNRYDGYDFRVFRNNIGNDRLYPHVQQGQW